MDRQIRKKEFLLRSYIYASETERKTQYKIPPRKNISITIGILLVLLIVIIMSLFLVKQRFYIPTSIFYGSLFLTVFVIGWRISVLKVVMLEISKYTLSIKYVHPIKQIKQEPPVLDIPLSKLESIKIVKEFFVYYLEISRRSERGNGVKNFYFRLGFLSGKQIENIREIINDIH